MREIYAPTEIDFNIYVSEINAEGVKFNRKIKLSGNLLHDISKIKE